MVGTRKSLPTSDTIEEETPAGGDRKLKNALKKLQIDALGPLKGEARAEKAETQTYHWRGAAYEVTAGTAEKWIENQPKRWQKRMSNMDEDDMMLDGEEAVEEQELPRRTTRKRKLSSILDAGEDAAGEEEPTPKRSRRNVAPKYYGRPKRNTTPAKQTRSTRNTASRRRTFQDLDDKPNFLKNDFTVVGGQEEMSCIEASRAHAASLGYNTEPIPLKKVERETLGKAVLNKVLELSKTNTAITKLYNERKAVMKKLEKQEKHEKEVEKIRAQEDGNAGPAENGEETNTSRHDSAASLTPPNLNPDNKAKPNDEIIAPPLRRLSSIAPDGALAKPEKNKHGNLLRWSLPEKLTEEGRAEQSITFSKMTGETKSARRRRVKRERKMLEGWPLESEAGAEDDAE